MLVHPGGPFWAHKDDGAWSLPKGVVDEGEELLEAAKRELREELGVEPPSGPWIDLGAATLRSRKIVHAFCARGDLDPSKLRSNEIEIDWPPRSGKKLLIPEIDRAEWFGREAALLKIHEGQAPLVLSAFAAELRGLATLPTIW